MKIFSLDIETTGLDETTNQIIEIGGVIDDLEDPQSIDQLPEFHCYVVHPEYTVSEYVLGMHSDSGIWKRLQQRPDGYDYLTPEQAVDQLAKFVYEQYITHEKRGNHPLNGSKLSWAQARYPENYWSSFQPDCFPMSVVTAGKNFGSFDLRFLKTLPGLNEMIRFHHRTFDPGPLYTRIDDDSIPNMDTCLERAGIDEKVPHHAVEDSKLVVKLIRNHFNLPY